MHCISNIYIKFNRLFPHFRFDSKIISLYNVYVSYFPCDGQIDIRSTKSNDGETDFSIILSKFVDIEPCEKIR